MSKPGGSDTVDDGRPADAGELEGRARAAPTDGLEGRARATPTDGIVGRARPSRAPSTRPPAPRSASSSAFPVVSPGRSITVSHQARLHLSRIPPAPGLHTAAELLLDALGLAAEGASLAVVIEVGHEGLGSAVLHAAQSRRITVQPYVVDQESLQNEAFVQRLCGALREATGSLYLTGARGIAPGLRKRIRQATEARRSALVLGADERLAMQSLAADRAELEALGECVRSVCQKSASLSIETLMGTELRIAWEPSTSWHHDRARLDAPGMLVLPAGRVIATPSNVTGTLVPDGGVLLADGELRSRITKLRVRFEGGRLVHADGPWAERLLAAVQSEPGADRVGQVVFGTNAALLTPIGHEGQDLTMPGIHLVLGDSRPEHTGAPFCAGSRVVLMVRRPDVRVGTEPMLVRGRYARALFR